MKGKLDSLWCTYNFISEHKKNAALSHKFQKTLHGTKYAFSVCACELKFYPVICTDKVQDSGSTMHYAPLIKKNTANQRTCDSKKAHWLYTNSQPASVIVTTLMSLRTTPSVPMNSNQPKKPYPSVPLALQFSLAKRELRDSTTCIHLTATEARLINALILSELRICSKQELILSIEKDTHSYSGLEMCLSRLQDKFRSVFGERLFRSVRNRGYCLVQDVKVCN